MRVRTPTLADQSALRWGKPSGGEPSEARTSQQQRISLRDYETCQLETAPD
jgi:hypothetical protein